MTRYEVRGTRYEVRGASLGLHRWWLVGCGLVGLGLRLVGLTRQGFWTDELYVIWEARQPLVVLFDPRLHIQHPPGYRLALHAWLGVSTAEGWIRLLPLLAGVLLIPVLWALARALWPERPMVANVAALLAATSPFLLHYSQDVTAYSWTLLWVAGSLLLLIHAWRGDRTVLWAAWAVVCAGALYSHYFSIFPLAAEGGAVVVAGLRGGQAARGRLAHGLLAIAGAAVLFLPWLGVLLTQSQGQLTNPLYPPSVDTQPTGWLAVLLAGYANSGFWLSKLGRALAWFALIGTLVAGGLAAGGWGLGLRGWLSDRWQSAIRNPQSAILWAWGLAAFVGPYLFLRLTTPPDVEDPVRFAALAAPALLLLLAGSVAAWPRPAQAGALALWLVLFAVQWTGALAAPPRQDWRGLLGQVAAGAQSGDALLAFPAFHAGAAAAYYPIPLAVQGGWFVPEGSDPTGAAYWFPPGWRWQGFLNTQAERSADWPNEIARHTSSAQRLWYLVGDGVDGTYPPSPAAEHALTNAGWRSTQEWRASPLVLRLYLRNSP